MPLLPPMQVSLENKKSTGCFFFRPRIYMDIPEVLFIIFQFLLFHNVHRYATQAYA